MFASMKISNKMMQRQHQQQQQDENRSFKKQHTDNMNKMHPWPRKSASSSGSLSPGNITTDRMVQLIVAISTINLFSLLILSPQVALGQETMDLHRRVKRALYDLPAGAEFILGPNLRTTFTCEGLGYGYYADQDNNCKIFHICQSFKMSDGSIYNNHWSFMCGNQTVFNQVTLACSHPEDAIPCESSRDFYHVNDYFGDIRAPSVRDSDLVAAQDLVSRSYGARLSSSAQ